ncbi:MAG: methyltransferase [Sphingomicrobium sp.]
MRRFPLAIVTILAATSACAAPSAQAPNPAAALAAAVAAPSRTPANVARDVYRHPAETLAFFGIRPGDTVVEIWPGGGWFTEILAPYLAAGGGRLIAANVGGKSSGIEKLKAAQPDVYNSITVAEFPVFDGKAAAIAPGTADAVLTFRNVHNWRMGYTRADKADYSADAFRQIYAMLKPGGVLGIEDHRLPETADSERERESGYMKPSTIIRLAQAAGLTLAGSSEINANPKDSADWPDGVWTLPPTYARDDVDRAKYAAIGESDRMTLKFVKPR